MLQNRKNESVFTRNRARVDAFDGAERRDLILRAVDTFALRNMFL
jgi:hypothetical protein